MSDAWFEAVLSDKPNTFGDFTKCHSFLAMKQGELRGQTGAGTGHENPSRTIFDSEESVLKHLQNLKNLQNGPHVCVVAFEYRSPASNGLLPLPLSRSLYEKLIGQFDIAPSYLSILSTGVATYIDNAERGHARFIIQQNIAYSCYSMAVTFNIRTGGTSILIFGAQSWSLSDLFACLNSVSSLLHGPMFVPTVALELQARWFNETMSSCHSRVYDIETTTGMRRFNSSQNDQRPKIEDWKTMDLIEITRDLNSLLARVAFLRLQCETGVSFTQQMQVSIKSLNSAHQSYQPRHATEIHDSTLSKLEHLHSWYSGIVSRLRYLTERIEGQIHTVYCLVASQDSQTTIEFARASNCLAEKARSDNLAMQAIAELSRRDSKLMLQIAEDSRAIALATAQDNAAIKVIAAITMLFLPATFTSTFFSMTFFNFLGSNGPQTSPWIWVYILVTVLLTALIQAAWAIMSKKKEKTIGKQLPDNREGNEMGTIMAS